MSKQILPHELAEIVTGLLLNSEKMGCLDEYYQYSSFFEDIAQVVVNHCGGILNGVSGPGYVGPDSPFLSCEESSPMASISYCPDSIGDPNTCVWAPYDTEGWEDETGSDESNYELTAQWIDRRSSSVGLLVKKVIESNLVVEGTFITRDWMEIDGEVEQGFYSPYQVNFLIGKQSYIDITELSKEGEVINKEKVTRVNIEINKGKPCVHVGSSSEDVDAYELHIIDSGEGLVLTPDDNDLRFESVGSALAEYAYNDPNALILKL